MLALPSVTGLVKKAEEVISDILILSNESLDIFEDIR